MSIQTSNLNNQRPLHFFDGELGALHSLLLEMTDLLMYQLEQTLHALDYGDIDLALKVVARDRKIDDYHTRIENEVRTLLSGNCSLASDLRTVMIISKITDALEKIGNEFAGFAGQLKSLFNSGCNDCDPELLAEIINIGGMIKIMLDKMMVVLETRNSNQAYKLMLHGWNCDTRLQQSLKHQLTMTIQHASMIEHALDIMHILKALERCAGLCRNIAEYQILMLDSVDMHPHSISAMATLPRDDRQNLQQSAF